MANKYRYLLVIQQNFGYGWEDISEYDSRTEYNDCWRDVREYRLSTQGMNASTRVIKRRELNS